eukprot:13495572-Heterocapsa_arctica.AAC.1
MARPPGVRAPRPHRCGEGALRHDSRPRGRLGAELPPGRNPVRQRYQRGPGGHGQSDQQARR